MRFQIGQVVISVHKDGATFTAPIGGRPFNLDVTHQKDKGYVLALFDQTIPVFKVTLETFS